MAKLDFCFTFYDGDAARDMAHMNRIERGCYMDIIISQRKFGALTLDQIKKILSKDFQECWPSIELVMVQEDEKYYIDWLRNSVEKAKSHSGHQSENGKLGGRKAKKKAIQKPNQSELNPITNQSLPIPNPPLSEAKPLGDGDGNGDRKGNSKRGGAGEKKIDLPFPSELFAKAWDDWKVYKQQEFKFKFNSGQSEKATLTKIVNLSKGDESTAIKIIQQSMANGWKGLFELEAHSGKAKENDDLQYLYERFLEGQLETRLIKMKHFHDIEAFAQLDEEVYARAKAARMNTLAASNDYGLVHLLEDYHKGVDSDAVKKDQAIVEGLAKRIAVKNFFKYLKSLNIKKVSEGMRLTSAEAV